MHTKATYYVYRTPFGRITLASDGRALTRCGFGVHEFEGSFCPSELTNEASSQLLEYLAGKRRNFTIALEVQGTQFQQRVWRELQRIPYGQTRSYAQVAMALGNAQAMRSVGIAAKHNPLPIFIPCHRVIGQDGKLVGYLAGLGVKRFLLDLEARSVSNGSREA